MANDALSKLEQRETKRKQSVVSAIINDAQQQPEQTEQLQEQQKNEGLLIAPKQKEETRSKRVNLLVKPSVYDKAQIRCKDIGISLNECINQFLEGWVNQN